MFNIDLNSSAPLTLEEIEGLEIFKPLVVPQLLQMQNELNTLRENFASPEDAAVDSLSKITESGLPKAIWKQLLNAQQLMIRVLDANALDVQDYLDTVGIEYMSTYLRKFVADLRDYIES